MVNVPIPNAEMHDFFLKMNDINCTHWSTDNKNKIKIGDPGEPLALSSRGRIAWTHDKQDLNSQDYDVGIKWPLTLSVQLNVSKRT